MLAIKSRDIYRVICKNKYDAIYNKINLNTKIANIIFQIKETYYYV